MASNAAARNDASTDASACLTSSGRSGLADGIAPVEAVGQQIILGDHIVRHAERMQDQRAGKSGAVLAGGAMDHQRRAVLQQMGEQRAEARRVLAHIVAVGIRASPPAHRPMTAARRRRGARAAPRPRSARSAANEPRSPRGRRSAAARSSVPRKSNALFKPRPRSTSISASVRWPRWLERKICRQRTVRPSLAG